MARDNTLCTEEPAVAPVSRTALFPNTALQRVCSKLLFAQLSDRTGLFVLVGGAGMGKSALMASMLAHSPTTDCRVGLCGRPDLSCKGLLDLWRARLGIPGEASDHDAQLNELGEFLSARLDQGAAAALLLDDAHSVQNEVLEMLSAISRWHLNGRKLVRIMLAGRPELTPRLDRPELAHVRKSIAFQAELGPLREAEVAGYIAHRLVAAGQGASDLFSTEAVASIAWAAAGVPRRINVLCHAAISIAKRRAGNSVSAEVAELAARACADFLRRSEVDGEPREDGAGAIARQAVPGQDWPWSQTGGAGAEASSGMLRPLPALPEIGRRPSRRMGRAARATAATLAGLAISVAAASIYSDHFVPWDLAVVNALAVFEDRTPPTRSATDTVPPRPPGMRAAAPAVESARRPESPADSAAMTDGVAARQRPPEPADEDLRDRQGLSIALQTITADTLPDTAAPGTPMLSDSTSDGRLPSVIDEAEAIVFKALAWRLDNAVHKATEAPSLVPAQAMQPRPDPSVEQLMARGDELLALGDIAAARLFYEAAANAGNAAAAAKVGMTYDPLYLERRGVLGAAANADKAIEWYNEAIAGGHARAMLRLDGLTAYLKSAASTTGGRPGPESKIETEPSAARPPQAAPVEEAARGAAPKTTAEALRIQLAAVKTKDAAMREGLRLQAMHRDLLGDKDLSIERLRLSGGRGVLFGIQMGPFPDSVSALDTCTKLKALQQDCFVVAPD